MIRYDVVTFNNSNPGGKAFKSKIEADDFGADTTRDDARVSLHGVDPETALRALLRTPPKKSD